MGAPAVVVRHDGFVRRDKLWRGAGLALPVFAVRTRNSVGVGEFLDLMQLVDFAGTAGMRLLQVSCGHASVCSVAVMVVVTDEDGLPGDVGRGRWRVFGLYAAGGGADTAGMRAAAVEQWDASACGLLGDVVRVFARSSTVCSWWTLLTQQGCGCCR
jgi:hypothetical protein